MSETIELDGRTIQLSSLDKLYFPQDEISKGDLITYYRRISEVMLPYLRERPLSMQRFPDGIDEGGFYQKEVPDHFPDWVGQVMVPVESEGEAQPQVVCNDAVSAGQIDEVRGQLPNEFAPLFTAGSEGEMNN